MSYQEIYDRAIANGCNPKFADMLASRKPPGVKSDTQTFTREYIDGTWKVPEMYRDEVMQRMKSAGVNPETHAYISQLAEYPMDPNACVSSIGELRRKCEQKGHGLEGMGTKIKPREKDEAPPPDVDVCPNIVEREFQSALEDNPDLAPTPREKADLKEKIKNKLKMDWN